MERAGLDAFQQQLLVEVERVVHSLGFMQAALLLSQREVDVLYELLESASTALEELGVPYVLIAGSLLGAVRSSSILFNDDDVDIAIVPESEEVLSRVYAELPGLLKAQGVDFKRRATPFCHRIRSPRLSHVWVDLFTLRRYDTLADVVAMVSSKDNGQPQSDEYIRAITEPLNAARFPIFHYDSRKGMELWPSEFFSSDELLHPHQRLPFGHMSLPAPANATDYLFRAFGPDCLDVFPNPHRSAHLYVAEFRRRLAAATEQGRAPPCQGPDFLPLEQQHYLPVLHSKHSSLVVSTRHVKE